MADIGNQDEARQKKIVDRRAQLQEAISKLQSTSRNSNQEQLLSEVQEFNSKDDDGVLQVEDERWEEVLRKILESSNIPQDSPVTVKTEEDMDMDEDEDGDGGDGDDDNDHRPSAAELEEARKAQRQAESPPATIQDVNDQPATNQNVNGQPATNQAFNSQPATNQNVNGQPATNQAFNSQPVTNQAFNGQAVRHQTPIPTNNYDFDEPVPGFGRNGIKNCVTVARIGKSKFINAYGPEGRCRLHVIESQHGLNYDKRKVPDVTQYDQKLAMRMETPADGGPSDFKYSTEDMKALYAVAFQKRDPDDAYDIEILNPKTKEEYENSRPAVDVPGSKKWKTWLYPRTLVKVGWSKITVDEAGNTVESEVEYSWETRTDLKRRFGEKINAKTIYDLAKAKKEMYDNGVPYGDPSRDTSPAIMGFGNGSWQTLPAPPPHPVNQSRGGSVESGVSAIFNPNLNPIINSTERGSSQDQAQHQPQPGNGQTFRSNSQQAQQLGQRQPSEPPGASGAPQDLLQALVEHVGKMNQSMHAISIQLNNLSINQDQMKRTQDELWRRSELPIAT